MQPSSSTQINDLSQPPTTIMVVEDEVLIRFVVAEYLRECGFDVIEAANVDEAVELLTSDVAAVDLVFSDVQMPGTRDGFALARWVREHRPNVPVILTSGTARTADLGEDLCSIGPVEQKPYHHGSLEKRIRRALAGATND